MSTLLNGRYEKGKMLGEGTYGVVWKCMDHGAKKEAVPARPDEKLAEESKEKLPVVAIKILKTKKVRPRSLGWSRAKKESTSRMCARSSCSKSSIIPTLFGFARPA